MRDPDDAPASDGVTMLARFELVAVIELDPGRFSERPPPTTPGRNADPRGWQEWWSACLGDADLAGLDPIAPASWCVAVRLLADGGVLTRVLERHIDDEAGELISEMKQKGRGTEDAVLSAIEEYVSPFDGGLALITEGSAVLEPGCCGDLSNLAGWDELTAAPTDDWIDLWTGHPYPRARVVGSQVVLTDTVYPDSTEAPIPRWAIERAQLRTELDRAREELTALADRLQDVVAGRFGASPAEAARIAGYLVGLRRRTGY